MQLKAKTHRPGQNANRKSEINPVLPQHRRIAGRKKNKRIILTRTHRNQQLIPLVYSAAMYLSRAKTRLQDHKAKRKSEINPARLQHRRRTLSASKANIIYTSLDLICPFPAQRRAACQVKFKQKNSPHSDTVVGNPSKPCLTISKQVGSLQTEL